MTAKTVQKFTKDLHVLYVEDDTDIRENTAELFKTFFESVDLAENGKLGLEAYESYYKKTGRFYDFVITDINMPEMNGIELIKAINKRNHRQTVIVTSAHDDSSYLMPLIELGVGSFILKPFNVNALLNVFFKDAQKVADRKFVMEKSTHMKIRYKQLKDAFEMLNHKKCQLEVKYNNLRHSDSSNVESKKMELSAEEAVLIDDTDYFAKDSDDGDDNILLLDEHCSDFLDYFDEIRDCVFNGSESPESSALKIVENLSLTAGILEFYSPYLDMLVTSLRDLADSIYRNMGSFTDILTEDLDSVSGLFDAIYRDMKVYAERFSVESLAMKNIHHIHEPTALSIQQIILLIAPEEADAGEIEFF